MYREQKSETFTRDLYMSYAKQDLDIIRKIKAELDGKGYKTWIDYEFIPPNTAAKEQLKSKGLLSANVVLVFFSKPYEENQSCRSELETAISQKKPIIYVNVGDGYSPENWIDQLIGSTFYCDISGSNFDLGAAILETHIIGKLEALNPLHKSMPPTSEAVFHRYLSLRTILEVLR